MPSSWSESNRLHSSRMREDAAEDARCDAESEEDEDICYTCGEVFTPRYSGQFDCRPCIRENERRYPHPLDIAEREYQEDNHLESVWEDKFDYGD